MKMKQKSNITNEIWKDIAGYEGYYQVSNFGRAKRQQGTVWHGNNKRQIAEKILQPIAVRRGYLAVCLCVSHIKKQCVIHRLVGNAFIDNPQNKPEINHKDYNVSNNKADNLEWVTRQENIDHSYERSIQAHVKGVSHPLSKLSEKQVLAIRKSYRKGKITYQDIASKYNVCSQTVGEIIRRKIWTHI